MEGNVNGIAIILFIHTGWSESKISVKSPVAQEISVVQLTIFAVSKENYILNFFTLRYFKSSDTKIATIITECSSNI